MFFLLISYGRNVVFNHFRVVSNEQWLVDSWFNQNHDGGDLFMMFHEVWVVGQHRFLNIARRCFLLLIWFLTIPFLQIRNRNFFFKHLVLSLTCIISESVIKTLKENMMHHSISFLLVITNTHGIIKMIEKVVINIVVYGWFVEIKIEFFFFRRT